MRSIIESTKRELPVALQFRQHNNNSFQGTAHYSFDFAQQVQYPSNPLQPGPIYFKNPRKCGLFGIHCEALSKQVNFLIDEGVNVGKGANCVVSLLHYFLRTMDWEKLMSTCMLTTSVDRIKTTACYNIFCGDY